MLTRLWRLLVVVALTVTVAACDLKVNIDNKGFDFFDIINRTGEPFVVFVAGLPEGHPYLRREVPAGRADNLYLESCLGTGAVAADLAGREIARLSMPLCVGGVWAFEADGTVVAYSHTAPGQLVVVPTPVPSGQRSPYPGWWIPSPSPTPSPSVSPSYGPP